MPEAIGAPVDGAVAWVTVNSPQPGVTVAMEMLPVAATRFT
jgi:hypothetical protein